MTNIQLYLTIGIPSILVILSWLSNKSNIAGLRSELRAEVASLRAEIGILRAGMNGLRKEIYEALIPLHERMAIIEIKQK